MKAQALESITQLVETAVAIGVFDGVHRGHQALLEQSVAVARSKGLTPVALTFHPHPSAVFAPARTPPLLGTMSERTALLRKHGAEVVVVAAFDRALAAQTPEEFVSQVLQGKLNARAVIIGEDFRFGCDRSGDVTFLRKAGERYGFEVVVVPPVFYEGVPCRSTTIRQMIAGGKIAEATRLLGRPYLLSGTVVHGRKLGRTIGFPTANLKTPTGVLVPAAGVYAGEAILENGQRRVAAISIGTNPTVTSGEDAPRTVEAFLLDFEGDLYDQPLHLTFHHYLRGTEKFPSLDALIEQMHRDVAEVRRRIVIE